MGEKLPVLENYLDVKIFVIPRLFPLFNVTLNCLLEQLQKFVSFALLCIYLMVIIK